MPPAAGAAAERSFPGILDPLAGIVAEARGLIARQGEVGAYARAAWAISHYDHETAGRLGAAAIIQLAEATR